MCTVLCIFFPQIVTDPLQYLYRHHGNLLAVGLSLGVGHCCSFGAYGLTGNFLCWLSILGCFPLCGDKQTDLCFSNSIFVFIFHFPIAVGGFHWDFLKDFGYYHNKTNRGSGVENKSSYVIKHQQVCLDICIMLSSCVYTCLSYLNLNNHCY